MNQRTLIWLLGALLLAQPAIAQNAANPQGDGGSSAREDARPATAEPDDRFERFLDFVERGPLFQLSAPRDGWGVRVGGINSGSAIAAGPVWRMSNALGGRAHVRASAAVSVARDHQIEAGLTVPALGSHRLTLDVAASADHLAHERFFGAGPGSLRADETTFALDTRGGAASLTLTAAPWFHVSTGARLSTVRPANGAAGPVPGILARWSPGDVPGLEAATQFAVASAGATLDWRDVPDNPRRGGRYHAGFERYSDRSGSRYSFSRVNVELEQHLSWWRRQRMLTLRGIAVLSSPDDGNDVPFYLQPTLGGSQALRGFVTDRFRDRNLLLLQAEYAWDIWPFLNAVLFYERGGVASDYREMTLKNLRQDYGIGFRLGSARTVAVRTDVAFGSGEGTRLTMRIGHAF